MSTTFKWDLCNFVGGDYAVHPSFKTYLNLQPDDWASGELTVTARSYDDIVISGLGFQPDVILLISFRPRGAGHSTDTSFGGRGGGMSFGVGSDSAQFCGSTRFRQGWDLNGYKRWREDVIFNVVHGGTHVGAGEFTSNPDSLTLTHTIDADGFTLTPTLNLWDQNDTIMWLAMEGNFKVGVIDAGDTVIEDIAGQPQGAFFLSCKTTLDNVQPAGGAPDPWNLGYWDHMQGFASPDGQNCIWGGRYPSSWDWTTERWTASYAIQLCKAATGSSFAGTSVQAEGRVTSWWADVNPVVGITRSGTTATVEQTGHPYVSGQEVLIAGADQFQYNGVKEVTVVDVDHYTFTVSSGADTPATGTITASVGGIYLAWDVWNSQPYRIGYILVGETLEAECNYLETNFLLRPAVAGDNLQTVRFSPYVLLLSGTNYTFNYTTSGLDPLSFPRLPDTFQSGGGGGFGWAFSPFSASGNDAYFVHTYGNGVAERGHYSNSATQKQRGCVAAGAGANSNPPAAHQHGINILPNPVIVGTNWRVSADRRNSGTGRLHVDPGA